jgi:hypothetical protein
MSQPGAYHLRRQPGAEAFAAAWDAALESAIDILRDTMLERAIHGVEVPIYSNGKRVGTRTVYNDRTATFMLRNYDGKMSDGASGGRLQQRKAIAQAVANARAEWEAEQDRDQKERHVRLRAYMDEVRRRLLGGEDID